MHLLNKSPTNLSCTNAPTIFSFGMKIKLIIYGPTKLEIISIIE